MILDPQRYPQVRNSVFKVLTREQYRKAARKFMGAHYAPCPKCQYPKLEGFSCRRCGMMHRGEEIAKL